MFPLRCRQADFVATINDNCDQLWNGIDENPGQLIAGVVDSGDKHKDADISEKVCNILNWDPGKPIHEKT